MERVLFTLLVLKTRQLEAMRAFYTALDIEFIEEKHGHGPTHYAAQLDGMVLEIYPLRNQDTLVDVTTRLGFKVILLNTTIEKLKECGASILSEPTPTQWGLQAVVRDPDGRSVELCQR